MGMTRIHTPTRPPAIEQAMPDPNVEFNGRAGSKATLNHAFENGVSSSTTDHEQTTFELSECAIDDYKEIKVERLRFH